MPMSLRSGLLNALTPSFFPEFSPTAEPLDTHLMRPESSPSARLIIEIVDDYFRRPTDTIDYEDEYKRIRSHVLQGQWHTVYDLVEFIFNSKTVTSLVHLKKPEQAVNEINRVLARELAAWRCVSGQVTPVTDPLEIDSLEESLSVTDVASDHLRVAIQYLADKNAQDFRNCVKEAISAVEAIVKGTSGAPKASFASAMKTEEFKLLLPHQALREAATKLYGYTSDASGIRHALTEGDTPVDRDTAKYLLIVCASFVNLVRARSTTR